MAGHSKWANIQHRKRAQDAKRGKVFTRLIREITVASRMGGSDPGTNPRLRLAVDKALAANMPKDTVERAIKRGAGELDDVIYEEIRYEGYGPAGVAVMVDCMTDNRNRTVAEVRHAFAKCGGNLLFLGKNGGAQCSAINRAKLPERCFDVHAIDPSQVVAPLFTALSESSFVIVVPGTQYITETSGLFSSGNTNVKPMHLV
jgi:hypothetical protein